MLQCSLLQERYYSNSIPKYRDREAIRVSFWCVCSLKLALEFQEQKAMDVFAFVFLSSSLFLFYFVFSDVANSITQSQSLSDSRAQTWSLKMEALSWGSSVQEIPLTVTWEFGTTISQLERLFG